MKKEYPYLKDTEFMYLADLQKLQNQFIKLILLDWDENPLEEIQGIATGGTISINGSSAIRRTCSLSMTVKDVSTGKITDAKNLISINKKVYIEIGIANKTNQYTDYDILWYPQGTFVFTQCSVTTGLGQGISLSAQLKDKMCLLNGECGGTITSSVVLDHYDTIDEETGQTIKKQPTISMIIRELVNHFGKEDLSRILINDLDERIKMVMRWLGTNPLYLSTNGATHLFTTSWSDAEAAGGTIQIFNYGQDVGFIYNDFVWTEGDLIANIGENICTILDKIKSVLGNFEYFYDIDGNFVFQEIKNYLNTTQATIDLRRMNVDDYVIDIAQGKTIYNFSGSKLITSFSHSPQYNNIKNDFVVWGVRETAEGQQLPIRYHLAIDKKPKIGNIYEVFFYNDPVDGLRKAKCPLQYENRVLFPSIGTDGIFYLDKESGAIYKWDPDKKTYVSLSGYVFQEYYTKDDFPELGSEDVVYVELSTQKRYIWTLVPGSSHYEEYTRILESLKLTYDNDVQLQKNNIEVANVRIQQYEKELEVLQEQNKTYLSLYNSNQTKINTYTEQKKNYHDKILKAQETEAEMSEKLIEYNKERERLQDEKTKISDPTKRQVLQDAIDLMISCAKECEVKAYQAQQEIIGLQSQLEHLHLDDKIIDATNARDDANAHLDEYNRLANNINQLIAGENTYINECNNIIDARTAQYELQRAGLMSEQAEYVLYQEEPMVLVKATDWRSELYLQNVLAEPLGLEKNDYYAELEAEWPKIYNLQDDFYTDDNGQKIYTGDFYPEVVTNPTDIDYWLDFIDSDGDISEFNIANIGRRSITENNTQYNCVFEAEVPDIIIIEKDQDDTDEKRAECEARSQDYSQVDSNIFKALTIGGLHNSCFNEIKNLLWSNTNYNSSITISAVPIYHLEPNTRITVHSNDADIHGDFMMNSLSIPLDINGTMSISATQVQTKL